MNVLTIIKEQVLGLIEKNRLGEIPVQIKVRNLTIEEAIGTPEDHDYPLIKGRERLLEAEILGCRGQAFTDTPGTFSGTLNEVFALTLTDNRNRAVFIATINAVMRHLGLAGKTIHCKDTSPPLCASNLVEYIRSNFGTPRIAMIGFQPRMIQALSGVFELKATDLDKDNIGQMKFGVLIQGPDRTQENIAWCDLAVVTGSVIVNGTIDELSIKKPAVFFGVTVAGPSILLGLNRYCPYGS